MAKWKYIYAIGRRKESVAIVKLFPNGSWSFVIKKWEKELPLKTFFGWAKYLYDNALSSLKLIGNDLLKKYDAVITVKWWWISGISDSIRLWFSRALILEDENKRTELKPYWLLKRDPRIKERKKPWLKKARKRPTRSKR